MRPVRQALADVQPELPPELVRAIMSFLMKTRTGCGAKIAVAACSVVVAVSLHLVAVGACQCVVLAVAIGAVMSSVVRSLKISRSVCCIRCRCQFCCRFIANLSPMQFAGVAFLPTVCAAAVQAR